MTVLAPSSYDDLRLCLRRAMYELEGIAVVRYPRGGERPLPPTYTAENVLCSLYPQGEGKRLLVTYGTLLSQAMEATAGTDTDVLKLTQIMPIPPEALEVASRYEAVYFAEEGIRDGGVGETFGWQLRQQGYTGDYRLRAIDGFVPTCTVAEGLKLLKLDAASLRAWLSAEDEHE